VTYCVRHSIAHSSGPTGIVIRGSSQGLSCSRPHGPCRPRGAGRPCRGARAPIRLAALGRARSASAPRGCEVPRARAARSGLVGGAVGAVAGLAHHRDDLLDRGRIGPVAQPLVCAAAARRDSPVGWPASDGGRRLQQLRHGQGVSSVDGWLAFELHESATRATSHRASGGLPVVHKGRSDAGGRSPARGRLVVVQGESHHCPGEMAASHARQT
jgi:hypothetical protein